MWIFPSCRHADCQIQQYKSSGTVDLCVCSICLRRKGPAHFFIFPLSAPVIHHFPLILHLTSLGGNQVSSAQGLSMQVVAPCEPGWHALIAEFEKTVHIYIGTFRSFSTQ